MKFNTKSLGGILGGGVFLIGIITILSISIANAQEPLPMGGDNFRGAVEIAPGTYITNREIAINNYEFFKVSLKAGQLLKVKFTTSSGAAPYAGAGIYNFERIRVQSNVIIADHNTSETLAWLSDTTGVFYITVGNEYNSNAIGTEYEVALKDYFDASTQTDAGNSFDKAISISIPGKYTAYLSGDKSGKDFKDFYKLTVKKNKTLTIKVTPQAEAEMKVIIYNSNRELMKDVYAPNPSAIVTNSVPTTKSGDVFIAISRYDYHGDPFAYTLDIKTETGAEVPTVGEEVLPEEPTGWAIEKDLTEEEIEKTEKELSKIGIMAWLLPVFIVLIVLVIIIIAIVVLIRKKKK